jgi:hypothetical protein
LAWPETSGTDLAGNKVVTEFALEHKIVAKRDRMDVLVARHNHLVSLVPKQIDQEVVPEFQLLQAEIDQNMEELLKLMAELEADCKRSPFFHGECSK